MVKAILCGIMDLNIKENLNKVILMDKEHIKEMSKNIVEISIKIWNILIMGN